MRIGRVINRVVLVVSLLFIGTFSWIGTTTEKPSHAELSTTVPVNINSSCASDVTAAINSWIASVPNGNTLNFGTNACYRLDGTVVVDSRANLMFDGHGSTFKAGTDGRELTAQNAARTRSQFSIQKSNHITMRNFIVYGANKNGGTGDAAYVAALEAQMAFNVTSSNNVSIENNEAYEVYGDFVYIGPQGGSIPNAITIKNNHFERNGRQGVSVTSGKNVLIENNTIANTRRSTFDVEPNTGNDVIDGVTIKNNVIGAGRLLVLANAGACASIKNIIFESNQMNRVFNMTASSPDGCKFKRENYTIKNNTSTSGFGSGSNDGKSGITGFRGITGLVFTDNVIPAQAGRKMNLVNAADSSNIRVTGNQVLNGNLPLYIVSNTTNYCYEKNQVGNPLKPAPAVACPVNQADPIPTPPPTNPAVTGSSGGGISNIGRGSGGIGLGLGDEAAEQLAQSSIAGENGFVPEDLSAVPVTVSGEPKKPFWSGLLGSPTRKLVFSLAALAALVSGGLEIIALARHRHQFQTHHFPGQAFHELPDEDTPNELMQDVLSQRLGNIKGSTTNLPGDTIHPDGQVEHDPDEPQQQ